MVARAARIAAGTDHTGFHHGRCRPCPAPGGAPRGARDRSRRRYASGAGGADIVGILGVSPGRELALAVRPAQLRTTILTRCKMADRQVRPQRRSAGRGVPRPRPPAANWAGQLTVRPQLGSCRGAGLAANREPAGRLPEQARPRCGGPSPMASSGRLRSGDHRDPGYMRGIRGHGPWAPSGTRRPWPTTPRRPRRCRRPGCSGTR